MPLYSGIDLHSNNSFVVVIDEEDEVLVSKRLSNRLETILQALEPHRSELAGVAVESTFNWYWLVDGLMDDGYPVQLVNTSAVQQYEGLKFTDDRHDARWLAHLMRLGILPTGYIYPKPERSVRDLLRMRARLVQERTANYLSLQNLLARDTGEMVRGNALKRLIGEQRVPEEIDQAEHRLAYDVRLGVIATLDHQIDRIQRQVKETGELKPECQILRTIPGVGTTLSMTIQYETGDIRRFPAVGNYASYCRCVRTARLSNRKKKGEGNRRNGNPYLSWAFGEAAFFARRFQPRAKRFFDRKLAQGSAVLAYRALAHKLCRAVYFMLRDQTHYREDLLFR